MTDAELMDQARTLHLALFPEEYDHIHDSAAEAQLRRQGISPMSETYLAERNAFRESLGLPPHDEAAAPSAATFDWVLEQIRAGQAARLETLLPGPALAPNDLPKADFDAGVEAHLSKSGFSPRPAEGNLEADFAYRLLGAIFALQPSGKAEQAFLQQIQRLRPEISTAAAEALYRGALSTWSEAYSG